MTQPPKNAAWRGSGTLYRRRQARPACHPPQSFFARGGYRVVSHRLATVVAIHASQVIYVGDTEVEVYQ